MNYDQYWRKNGARTEYITIPKEVLVKARAFDTWYKDQLKDQLKNDSVIDNTSSGAHQNEIQISQD